MTYGGSLATALFYQRESALLENQANVLQDRIYRNHTQISNMETTAINYNAGSPQLRQLHAQITQLRHVEAYFQRQLSIVSKKMEMAEKNEEQWMERASKYLERMSKLIK
ncbi:MAG: hypothetical protein KC475_03655 [Cyanobacteria bacterium HKST-UBA03]|nr:hypothetical protein [Cyanobacteria bacterium HKST-UBA03]